MEGSTTAPIDALAEWLRRFAANVSDHREFLTELDSAIGDADHGTNLDRGMRAAVDKLGDGAPAGPIGEMFKAVGMTLISTVGGASGPLYGTFFLRFGTAAGPVQSLDAAALGSCLRAGYEGVLARGKAERGDKTMVDAMAPAVDAFDGAVAGGAAPAAAAAGRDGVVAVVARKGRASYLGERSAGHADPGSVSTTYLFEDLAAALGG